MSEPTGGTVEDFDPPDDWNPTAALLHGLTAQAKGEPVDEVEMQAASMVLAAAALVERGIPYERATQMVDQALDNGTIHISWSEEDGLDLTLGHDTHAQSGRTVGH